MSVQKTVTMSLMMLEQQHQSRPLAIEAGRAGRRWEGKKRREEARCREERQ
jgi:hypothetical protein